MYRAMSRDNAVQGKRSFHKTVLKRTVALTMVAAFILVSGCVSLRLPAGEPDYGKPANPAADVVDFYRERLNRLQSLRSGACPMHPSCSEYSRQAILKHGPILGWIMTCDRLMRCGRDETAQGERIYVNGSVRVFDPLEANDFWLDASWSATGNSRLQNPVH